MYLSTGKQEPYLYVELYSCKHNSLRHSTSMGVYKILGRQKAEEKRGDVAPPVATVIQSFPRFVDIVP